VVISVIILLLFIGMAFLMMKNKVPTILALPILAVLIAAVARVPFYGENGIMNVVFEAGALRMSNAIVALMVGAWLGELMNHMGVSKTIIRTAAELGGDKPLLVTILLSIAMVVIYTTISGLGSVIMIATIAVPIMISVGVKPLTAIVVFIFSYGTGLTINMTQWTYFTSVTGVPIESVRAFAFTMFALTAVSTLLFILISFKRDGMKFSWAADDQPGGGLPSAAEEDPEFVKPPMISLLTPLIPIVLVMVFKFTILTALFSGMLYCFLTVWLCRPQRKKNLKKLVGYFTKAAIDGVNDSAIGVVVMIGIGMLVSALTHPDVSDALTSTMSSILPSGKLGFVLFFAVLAPLALYRGPMNIWGLGGGLATLIITMNVLPAVAVMCAFLSCERVQVLSDPTNTYCVWLSNYVGTDTNQILKKTLPFSWSLAILGVVLTTLLWF